LVQHESGYPHVVAPWLEASGAGVVYGTVGWFIARRVPDNRLGGLMLMVSVASGLQLAVGTVTITSVQQSWPLVIQDLLGGLYSGLTAVVVGSLLLIVLMAPSGRSLNRFFHWVVVAVIVSSAIALLAGVGLGTDDDSLPGGPSGHHLAPADLTSVLWNLNLAALLVVVGCSLLALVGLSLRYMQSHGEQRRQVTWVVGGGLAGVLVLWLQAVLSSYLPDQPWIGSVAWILGPSMLPLGIAVAVLRHGLYQLDNLVSRTVSYAIVTGGVLLVYVLVVAGVSQLAPSSDNLAIAAATLAAAATSRPLLRRVRIRVDKRFNRARFDHALAVATFSKEIRNTVDPGRIEGQLVEALQRTLEPRMLDVWVRSET
jgi:hypothetical protein